MHPVRSLSWCVLFGFIYGDYIAVVFVVNERNPGKRICNSEAIGRELEAYRDDCLLIDFLSEIKQ